MRPPKMISKKVRVRVGVRVKTERILESKPVTRFALVEVEIINMENGEKLCTLERVPSTTTIRELKELFERKFPAYYPERQAFFLDRRTPGFL